MSWRTASYFSSRPAAATNSSRYLTAIPGTPGYFANQLHSQRYARADAQAHTPGKFSQRTPRFFVWIPLHRAVGLRPARLVARFPHFWGLAPAAKYTYI